MKIINLKHRKIKMAKGFSSYMQGGLFQVEIEGPGTVCLGTWGQPLVLLAGPHNPLYVDPQCAVCWSASLNPVVKADITVMNIIGRGAGEMVQVCFIHF
jgi:uncharacterized protein (AIM24 family)